jgi:glycosyltransferase involved in cell wall biosynthesis
MPATVSIFVPSYNRRHYLREALESLLAQTYRDFRVVIVDDGSTDGAAQLAAEYAERHPQHVVAICKPRNTGVTDTVTRGMAVCRESPIVGLMADDDLWEPTKLERQVPLFDQDPRPGIVFSEAYLIDEHGERLPQLFSERFEAPDLDNPTRFLFTQGVFICTITVLMSREALELVEFTYPVADGTMNDVYWWIVVSAEMPLAYVPEPLASWRRHSTSISAVTIDSMHQESYVLRKTALRNSPAVRARVGRRRAARALDDHALYWGIACLRAGDLERYRWWARQVARRPSPRAQALFAARSVKTLAGKAVRSRLQTA